MDADGSAIHPAQRALAQKFCSVWLLGPPPGAAVERLVAHLFPAQDAELALELPMYRQRSAAAVAGRIGREPADVEAQLSRMAAQAVIYGGRKGYTLLPLVPGQFEYLLMGGGGDDWYRTYAELFEEVFGSGYASAYTRAHVPVVRTVPATGVPATRASSREITIEQAVDSRGKVVDDDALLAMLRAHERFGVLNVCQCRQSRHLTGHRCRQAAPVDGCLIFGTFATSSVEQGKGRVVSRDEICEIIERRREQRLVFLAGNVAPTSPNVICTCCECCCHALQLVNEWGGQRWLAPPRFLLAMDESRCDHCGLCRPVCGTRAHQVERRVHTFHPELCIGCGNCVDACPRAALMLEPNRGYRKPARSFTHLGARIAPSAGLALLRARGVRRRE
jgi:ferredoxin